MLWDMGVRGATDLLVWGIATHLLGDFFLQNAWESQNKSDLRGLAAWTHGATMTGMAVLVFPLPAALLIGLSHVLIDTRKPLEWWRRTFTQRAEGPAFYPFAMLQDQSAHILVMAAVALVIGT